MKLKHPIIAKHGTGENAILNLAEVDQLNRLMYRVTSKIERTDFLYQQLRDFVRQSDERKGTNACELFPELAHLF